MQQCLFLFISLALYALLTWFLMYGIAWFQTVLFESVFYTLFNLFLFHLFIYLSLRNYLS